MAEVVKGDHNNYPLYARCNKNKIISVSPLYFNIFLTLNVDLLKVYPLIRKIFSVKIPHALLAGRLKVI